MYSTDPDAVFEIKYIRRGFKSAWLRESAMRLALADQLYNARLKRRSNAVLIVIFSGDETSQPSEFEDFRTKVQTDLSQRGVRVRIEYMSETEIPVMSCEQMKLIIQGGGQTSG